MAYAYGTGSSSSQQLSLLRTDQPNLRILAPLSWDQRHKVNLNLDYRFAGGRNYNGPKLFGNFDSDTPISLASFFNINLYIFLYLGINSTTKHTILLKTKL